MAENDTKEGQSPDENRTEFGYATAVAGFALALLLTIVMFATSGQV